MTAYVVSFSWLCVRCLRHGVVGSGWGVVAGVPVFAGVGMRAPGDRLCVFFPAGVLLVVPVGAMGQF